jgi:hypothetical protein
MHPVQTLSNGGIGNVIMDPTGTINPAALNSAGKKLIFCVSSLKSALGAQPHRQTIARQHNH